MLDKMITDFSNAYLELKQNRYVSSPETKLLTQEIPELLYEILDLDESEYLVRGSVGTGQWSDVPWVCIMHRGVTETTRNGYYIAALFSSDMKSLYITVGLGWTQFLDRYGSKLGKVKVKTFANKLAQSLPSSPDEIKGIIDLKATTQTSQGYEYSNMVSMRLDIESTSRESYVNSFKTMLSHYEFLRNKFGSDIFYDSFDDPEEETINTEEFKSKVKKYSSSVNKSTALKDLVAIAELEPPARRKVMTMQIIRNKAFADFVKERAEYICEICGRKPFKKQNGQPYAEADHIDMLGDIGKDHPDNMRCLCAQCHRVITYGSEEEIARMQNEVN